MPTRDPRGTGKGPASAWFGARPAAVTRARRSPPLLSSLFVLWMAGSSWALLGETEGTGGVDGSVRTIAIGLDNYSFPPLFGGHEADFISQTIVRVVLAARPTSRLSWEAHFVETFDYGTARNGVGGFGLDASGSGATRYRAVGATWRQDGEGSTRATLTADRFAATIAFGRLDLTIGRQAITLGKAWFWNPLDEFLAFDPRSFDRDYKPGVDALRLAMATGDFSGVELIAVAGRELDAVGDFIGGDEALDIDWKGSAVLARGFTSRGGWDLALQGGKVYGGYSAGAGAVGELGPLEVRLEGVWFSAVDSPALPFPLVGDLLEDAFSGVIGLGHRFENSFTLEAEFLRNGQGDPDHLDVAALRFSNGSSFHLSRNVLGVMASYEILPIVTGQVASLVSLDDGSAQLQPGLTWSVTDEVEAVFGAILGFGDRPVEPLPGLALLRSEFGTFPHAFYMEWKAYF